MARFRYFITMAALAGLVVAGPRPVSLYPRQTNQPPPAESPPAESPPVQVPPVESPPVASPPVQIPPVQTLTTESPPAQIIPAQSPPAQSPPTESPPAESPPTETPADAPKSLNGKCGPAHGGTTCTGTRFGDCCSIYGYCGTGNDYCGRGLCESGACADAQTSNYTADGTCGPKFGMTLCGDREWGPCCSIYGYCGGDELHCGLGNCVSGPCATGESAPGGPSLDGTCGPSSAGNKTCSGTGFGSCCSLYGYCGSSEIYCGRGNCYSGACV